jgi:hypothetical protein
VLPSNLPVASEPPSPDPPSGPQPEPARTEPSAPEATDDAGDLPPLDDPYLNAPVITAPPRLSKLAITSLVAPLLLGPVGALAGIVFGWSARRAIEASKGRKRGYGLATAGMALGVIGAMTWGALLSLWVWTLRFRTDLASLDVDAPPGLTEPGHRRAPVPSAAPEPAKPDLPASGFLVPKTTTTRHEGAITLVDVGISATSLKEALAKERALAANAGETMVVMTTGGRCEPCQGVDTSFRDPLMQTALGRTRLVRVDVRSFQEDLNALKIPSERIPGFYLLALDLTPRDGIDGGEWDADIARNIAPVLGAFVRGKYTARREAWKPLPGSGMRL